MEVKPAVCPLDCPDRCALDVTVDQGRIVKIDGSKRSELTDGVPNVGVSEAGKFRKRYAYINRYLEVRVHTVQITTDAAAKKPSDTEELEAKPLLEGLAKEAGGAFLQR